MPPNGTFTRITSYIFPVVGKSELGGAGFTNKDHVVEVDGTVPYLSFGYSHSNQSLPKMKKIMDSG